LLFDDCALTRNDYYGNMVMNEEYKRIWKKAVVAYLKILTFIYLQESINEESPFSERDLSRVPLKYKSDALSMC
jgi:hypothetical protein